MSPFVDDISLLHNFKVIYNNSGKVKGAFFRTKIGDRF
nr:MAG TPA: hypothetical protein [Caudoviricetes sp.]